MRRSIFIRLFACLLAVCTQLTPNPIFAAAEATPTEPVANVRRPESDQELRRWLQNMVWYHSFAVDEIHQATGLDAAEICSALERFDISPRTRPKRPPETPLLMVPYPGGRHPRIGFLDGAIDPQRETKVSVFTPWDDESYVVFDVPEAIWSNLGLTYLAHTHVPTIWTKQNIELPKQEWQRQADGSLVSERTLPNGITFGTKLIAHRDHVQGEMWLKNNSSQKLTDLRVQNCVMLKGAQGFNAQTNENKVFSGPYAACRSEDGNRWIITAWDPVQLRVGECSLSLLALRSAVSRLRSGADAAPPRLALLLLRHGYSQRIRADRKHRLAPTAIYPRGSGSRRSDRSHRRFVDGPAAAGATARSGRQRQVVLCGKQRPQRLRRTL